MSKKKGQIFAEPFFWILALITAALVLTFGYMAVKRLNDTFDKTSIAKWSTNFKKVVDEVYYMDTGSSKSIAIMLPKKVKGICFYDGANIANSNVLSPTDYRTIQLNPNKNMAILPAALYDSNLMLHSIGKLKAASPLCVNNGANLRLVSRGDYVSVELPIANRP
ncbi:hypothetical protein J4231_00515 [Candidatus Woesearchaeota archaeon]|nr:hypothetical protein [Candidatus Woesearchaeota archaeon]